MTIGTNIRVVRASRGMRQQELAAKVGIKGNVLCDYENDVHAPSILRLREIAQALDVTVSYLLDEHIWPWDRYALEVDRLEEKWAAEGKIGRTKQLTA